MAKTSPGEFLRQVRSEASKIYWPSRQETVTTAIFVGILTTVLALFFMGIDSLFGALVRWALSLVELAPKDLNPNRSIERRQWPAGISFTPTQASRTR